MRWLSDIRRAVVWILGAVLIIDALIGSADVVPELIIGLVMIGVLPLEDVVMTYATARSSTSPSDPYARAASGGKGAGGSSGVLPPKSKPKS